MAKKKKQKGVTSCSGRRVAVANGVFIVEQATVYRAGGRRWLTRKAAIKAYAAAKFRRKHPCECEQEDYASGYPGYTCPVHDARERVLPRYIRVLRRHLELSGEDGGSAAGSSARGLTVANHVDGRSA